MDIATWITIPELARRLGVTRTAAWRHVDSGAIPAVRLGSRYYVAPDALEQLAARQAEDRRRERGER